MAGLAIRGIQTKQRLPSGGLWGSLGGKTKPAGRAIAA